MRLLPFLLSALAVLPFSAVQAQVPNLLATDCSSTSRTLYDPLDQGKVLVVLIKGWDCSICQNSAPGWDAFADTANSNIEVWCAMNQLYGTGLANCTHLDTWNTNYGFDNIWMFSPDVMGAQAVTQWENQFCGIPCNGFPRYTVINPADKTVAYYGNNATTARSTAQQLSQTSGVLDTDTRLLQLSVFPNPTSDRITLAGLQQYIGELQIRVVDVHGRVVLAQTNVLAGQANAELQLALPLGVYTLVASHTGGQFNTRVVVQ